MSVIPAPPAQRRTADRSGLITVLVVIIALLVAVIAALVVSGLQSPPGTQVRGSGVAATQTRALPGFTALNLAGSGNVIVTAGGRQSVVVHADSNLLRNVTTRVASGTLLIGTTGSFTTASPMSVVVTVPSLTSVRLSGSGTVAITGISTPHLTVTLPGSGIIRASGTVIRLDVTLDGSGEALLTGLMARNVRAIVAGSGQIRLTATSSLYAAITGTGAISYTGNPPHLTTKITGTGAITPG